MRRLKETCRWESTHHLVATRPQVVQESVGHFTRALGEAVLIVLLAASSDSDLRAGAWWRSVHFRWCLRSTFVVMDRTGSACSASTRGPGHRARLLVDDAIIAVDDIRKSRRLRSLQGGSIRVPDGFPR